MSPPHPFTGLPAAIGDVVLAVARLTGVLALVAGWADAAGDPPATPMSPP